MNTRIPGQTTQDQIKLFNQLTAHNTMLKLQRANELIEKEHYITHLSKKNNKRKVHFNLNKPSRSPKRLRKTPRKTISPIPNDALSQEETTPSMSNDYSINTTPDIILLPNTEHFPSTPSYGNPIVK